MGVNRHSRNFKQEFICQFSHAQSNFHSIIWHLKNQRAGKGQPIKPSIPCTQKTMLQVQCPAVPAPYFAGAWGPQHYISSHRTFVDFPTTSRTCKPAAEYLQTGEDSTSEDSTSEGTNAFHEHAAELLRLYYRMVYFFLDKMPGTNEDHRRDQ